MFDVGRSSFKPILDDMINVQKHLLRMVSEATSRVTPPVLEKSLAGNFGLTKKEVKAVIRELVAEGELAYTYEFGTTFLEISFNRPVRVSSHLVLKPPEHHYQPETGDVVIAIKPGAAFGDGRHPTSRLAVRGIEYVLKDYRPDWAADQNRVLDIGTGSGILVIAAVLMGIAQGLGIDIDPSARAEARENVSLNRLKDLIAISNQSLETIDGAFNLVTANLRYPTLKTVCSTLTKIMCPEGFLVCSGIRSHELSGLIKAYESKDFKCLWSDQSHDWAGVVFKRGY